ncbi:hypothetical protein GS982_02160 [Rhodococcus hoagii]|uniref:Minor tail protein n=1 Tax=Rhodococcus hoagii TaxID=43767 RepID=A0A9Q2S5Z6_RHOHA|nr:hypothetical protein [Prescottella equi]MBM4567674.1 hypothetical protein [Prescottella equi]MBM4595961.1 hypothetical protein [Prescottella equi]MCU7531398.1 hypothetical protein [Prescottella equi]MCU7535488.1 hypothetical protein [Prescottella equi]NKT71825.1 hypothetical protein [Prescottella equi]
MAFTISVLGAGGGPETVVSGPGDIASPFVLGEDQVKGLYHAPVESEWKRARRQRGGSLAGVENPTRDMQLGFHIRGDARMSFAEAEDLLRSCFTYRLDPWWPGDTLARIAVESGDDYRTLSVQMYQEPEFAPQIDPEKLRYGNVFYRLRAAQPFWESVPDVTHWETSGTSGSGTITVSNPTDVEMFQTWVLTRGTWTVPDVSWTGRPRRRTPGGLYGSRSIPLKPVTSTHGTLTIQLDPMHVMMQSANGTNVMGEVGGGYYFMHTIPPHTPKTQLPISVTGAPAGGARAELHQPRLWSNFYGGR